MTPAVSPQDRKPDFAFQAVFRAVHCRSHETLPLHCGRRAHSSRRLDT